MEGLRSLGIEFDEGMLNETEEAGDYGPYQQSHRAKIYQVFAKELVQKGKAYPCFCTEEELADIRQKQEELKENFGYHTKYARHRDMTYEQIKDKIDAGEPYVLRFRREGIWKTGSNTKT